MKSEKLQVAGQFSRVVFTPRTDLDGPFKCPVKNVTDREVVQ